MWFFLHYVLSSTELTLPFFLFCFKLNNRLRVIYIFFFLLYEQFSVIDFAFVLRAQVSDLNDRKTKLWDQNKKKIKRKLLSSIVVPLCLLCTKGSGNFFWTMFVPFIPIMVVDCQPIINPWMHAKWSKPKSQ